MTEKELINEHVPRKYSEQMALNMTEKERNNLTAFLHDDFEQSLIESGFMVLRSSYRGKSNESIERELKIREKLGINKPLSDLCGIRFVFETDEEIDKVIDWIGKEYCPPDEYDFKAPWIRDFRKNDIELRYRAVHIRLPFKLAEGEKEYVDLMEVQLVTDKQEEINLILPKRVNLNDLD